MRKRDLRVIFTVSGGWAGRPLAPRSIGYDSTYELDGGWISANCSATQWNPTRHEGVLNLNDGVTAIGGGQSTDYSPFYDRNDVMGVDLSQSKIRTIGDYTFYGCTGLETIDIPSTVNEIGDYAFDCENLTAVICRATVPPALGSHNFTNENDFLYVPEGSVEAYQNDEDWSGAFLRIYPIGYVQHTIRYNAETAVSGNWVADNTDTGLNEFDDETGDGVLYLNTDINTIGGSASTDDSPFYNKTDLVSVDLDDSGITGIGHSAFRGCTSLTSFDIPSGQTEIGGYAFGGCTSLTSIVIPEGIVRLRGSVFRDCSSLASVSFPSTLTNIGGNSFRGTALTSVTIPSGVTLIDPYAFDCASLTTVTCNATTPPVLESNNFTATGDTLYVPYASLEAYQNDTDWSSAFTSIRPIGYTYITVGAGEHGSATGSGWYQVDAYVIITATADEHYHFDRWNDGNTSNPRAIIVGSTDTTYTASFAVDEFTLIATGDAHTTVTGSGTYPYGTEVQITATPAEHYHFTSWSDGDTTNPRTVTVTGNMTLSATSAINTYTITVSAGQHGTASGSGTYPYGSFVQISATADSDYHFSQWNDGNTDNPRTITVTADATYTASFESDAFTVTITGDAHTTVTGSGSYPYGTQVQISATPDEHYHFVAWSDGDTNATRTITVTGNITLSASSAVNTYTITVNAGQHGSASGSGTYGYGTQVQISATADTYYRFTAWNDGNTDNPRTVTVTGNATYTASIEAMRTISYNAGTAASGNWVDNNTETALNSYDSQTGDGVLYLKAGVTIIGGGGSTDNSPFYQKSDLTSVNLAFSGLTAINNFAFRYSTLTTVTLPSTLTSFGNSVFRQCASLVTVENFENTAVTTRQDKEGLFMDCTALKNISLPPALTHIGYADFRGCSALTTIDLPSTLTTIGNYAFNGCSSLATVTCLATTPPTLGTNNFTRGGDMLYVPYASLSSYQNDSNWRTVFTSIRPIDYSYITVTAGANGSVSGSGWYEIGTTATITATPDTGYEFSAWNDGNTTNPRTISVGSTDVTYTASFEEISAVIRYTSTNQATGDWVTNNTKTSRNTYNSTTHEGVLYLNSGVTTIGGGSGTSYSPFHQDTGLTSIDFSDSGLTTLGSYTCAKCTNLTTAVIGDSVTSLGTANDTWGVFEQCTSLSSVSIGNSVTLIGKWAIASCSALTTLVIPSSVTAITQSAIVYCLNLTSVTCNATTPPTLGSGNFTASDDTLYVPAASVSAYQSDSAWSSAFTTITAIPTPVQHTISYTTADPQYGASAVDGNWVTNNTDTAQNTYTSVAWQYGNRGEGVLYLNSGVTTIGGGQSTAYSPFYESSFNHQTDTIDLSNSGLTSIGDYGLYDGGFIGSTLVIPEGVTTIGDHGIGESTTGGGTCSYDLPSTLTSIASNGISVGSKGYIDTLICRATTPPTLGTNAISADWGLGTLYVPASSVSAYQSSAWGSLGFQSITAISVPAQIRYNAPTAVSGNWVTNNTDTTKNTYDSVTGNGVLYLNSGVTTIGGGSSNTYSPFYYKADLVSVDLSDSGLTSIDKRAFMSCASMASITLPDGLTTIGDNVFLVCSSLTSINIPSTVTSISSSGVFNSCTALASITVASGNSVYNDGNGSNCIIRSNGNTLIYGCKNTVMPNNLNSIATYAFAGCSGLTSITIPNSVTSIAGGAFAECTGLTSITIPNSVTSIGVSDSGHGAFENCSGLVSLTIGSGVTSIGASAFGGCGSLVNVTCYATTPPTLYNYNFTASNDTLKVPSASVSAYQSATAWANAFTTITSI